QIAAFDGLKVQFIQDEYRWIDEITGTMRDLGIDVIFTAYEEPDATQIYGERVPGAARVTTLTGYIPDRLLDQPAAPLGQRPVDVGYRGREVPYWLGELGQEKVRIATG